MLGALLEGYAECDFASNGNEALSAVKPCDVSHNPYDLVLLDYKMPELDGIEFVKRIREHEEQAGINLGEGVPIIMITAYEEVFMKAFRHGADDYVLKPVNGDVLLAKIREAVKNKPLRA